MSPVCGKLSFPFFFKRKSDTVSQYRTYEFVIYQQPHVQGKEINVPDTTIRNVKKAVAFAKEHVGRGAGIYSITKGSLRRLDQSQRPIRTVPLIRVDRPRKEPANVPRNRRAQTSNFWPITSGQSSKGPWAVTRTCARGNGMGTSKPIR